MFKRLTLVLGLLVMLGSGRFAAAQTAPAATKPLSDLKITLMDGSLLNGKLSIAEFTVDTRFGTLKVPVDQIQSFRPGLQSHTGLQTTLMGLINDLGADTYATREKAQQAIIKMGPDIRGELVRLAKTVEGERAARLQKIIEDFEAVRGDDEDLGQTGEWSRDDVIVTPGFVVVGRITTPGFAIASNYGTLQVKMEDVREGRREGVEAENIAKNVSVPGAAISQRAYVSTGIKLAKGDQVSITASGSITLTPWGSSRVSTPDGATNVGAVYQGFQVGTLVLRVGDGGTLTKVGTKLTWTADKAGVLNLGIACPDEYAQSYTFPGEYQVKIRVTKK
jgi:hypothetical protein